MKIVCDYCGNLFSTYPSLVVGKKTLTCSYACAGLIKRGNPNYVRTPEHKAKMSAVVSARDQTKNAQRFRELNASKKGKTLEEIYGGEKATILRSLHSSKVGEKNNNWRGGRDRNKYPWAYYQIRTKVIERDGDVCLHCGVTGAQERANDRLGRGLTVHHIDHNKANNNMGNLITFCKRCNSSANGKSKDWEKLCLNLLGA